jgi:uncharacterized membrane protein YhaH (DUF805 family)
MSDRFHQIAPPHLSDQTRRLERRIRSGWWALLLIEVVPSIIGALGMLYVVMHYVIKYW